MTEQQKKCQRCGLPFRQGVDCYDGEMCEAATEKKCCGRCRDSSDINGMPYCNNAQCKCQGGHTEKKSVREEFAMTVSAQLPDVKDYTVIMSAFDSALEAIAVQIDGNGFVQPSQAGQFGMHADGFNQGLEEAAAIIRSHKQS